MISADLERLLRQIAAQLQLPETTHATVRSHYDALAQYLAEGRLERYSPALFAQGSYRIGTTVKPIGRDEFDLDFIVELTVAGSLEPGDVYELVASEIERNGQYRGRTERKSRCIRISYAGQFHTDVVPAVPDQTSAGAILIPEREGNKMRWRSTDPKGYVRWFEAVSRGRLLEKYAVIEPLPPQGGLAQKTALQVGVQLLKRHHHIHVEDEKLRTPSIVLTTIAGLAAPGVLSLGESMNAIVTGLHDYARSPQHISHPTAPNEILTEKWAEPAIFSAYCAQAEKLAIQWGNLIASTGQGYPATTKLLRQMFGEEPVQLANDILAERRRSVSQDGRLRTAAGGTLIEVPRGQGNPRKTFFGGD